MVLNILKVFKQLEAAEVDPSLLAYSIILSKDPDNYQSFTPQHKIGKSLNKESGGLIKYYKTSQQDDGYKGYSTDYRDLNIDIYKAELRKLVREVLRLLNCDIQELEDKIFPITAQDEDRDTGFGINYTSRSNKKNNLNKNSRTNNIQKNESLDRYQSLLRILPELVLPQR